MILLAGRAEERCPNLGLRGVMREEVANADEPSRGQRPCPRTREGVLGLGVDRRGDPVAPRDRIRAVGKSSALWRREPGQAAGGDHRLADQVDSAKDLDERAERSPGQVAGALITLEIEAPAAVVREPPRRAVGAMDAEQLGVAAQADGRKAGQVGRGFSSGIYWTRRAWARWAASNTGVRSPARSDSAGVAFPSSSCEVVNHEANE